MSEYVSSKNEYKKVKIPFGFNKNLDKVMLSLFHTFFVAITGHGKTLGMKSLLLRFHELYPDWKILIIDSKDKRDYADLNADIPICFVETTEPLDLKNLLEPIVGAKMMYYFDKIIEEAIFDTLGEIQRNIERKITEADEGTLKMSRRELGKLRVLNHLLKKLVKLVERAEITSTLELQEGFNVMPVSLPKVPTNLKRAFQQLIVRSVIRKLMLVEYEKVLLVLDENHKWSPQRYSSIVKQPLSELISEGRGKNVFIWMADQALTKVDKEPLKNVKIWVVGQQLQEHEVEDAITAVSDIADLKVNKRDIKSLRVGNWIIVDGMHRTVEHVYLQPYTVPDEVALQIVEGANPELAERYIFEFESKLSQSLGDEDLVWKERFEEEKRKREELEKNLLKDYIEVGQHGKAVDKLTKEIQELSQKNIDQETTIKSLGKKLEVFRGLETIIVETVNSHLKDTPLPTASTPQSINLEHEKLAVNLVHKGVREVKMSTSNKEGQILYCALNDLPKEGFAYGDMQKALFEHGWSIKNTTLSTKLSVLTSKALLIKTKNGYRLPLKVRVNVKKLE